MGILRHICIYDHSVLCPKSNLGCCYIYPASGKICAQMGNPHTIAQQIGRSSEASAEQNQVPIVQVQPVIISQYAATFRQGIYHTT